MVLVYGSKLCPDCIAAEKAFAEKKVDYEYREGLLGRLFCLPLLAGAKIASIRKIKS